MFLDILFNLFIEPLELVFEFIFSLTYLWFSNPGISILALSLVMNFLVLPLYKRADAIQEEEKNKVNSMADWVSHIKKTFKGDERYMMLNEYYRQCNYSPVKSLRSSFSLLLQIPFFIAAYHYLSNLPILEGMSFLVFKDLGAPDGLLNIGGLSINVMPLIMTAINVFSALVYLKGFPIKDKIQTYGIAAIFLVLLYNSPSGLVFYWTLNQIFSLCKNVIMKLAKKNRAKESNAENQAKCVKPFKTRIFVLGGVFATLLMGLLIPLSVISSSPTEFVGTNSNPTTILVNSLCIAAGFFIVWFGIFYYLAKPMGRRIMTYVMWVIGVGGAVNYLFFGTNLGTLSAYLIFDEDVVLTAEECIWNISIAVLVVVALVFIMKYCHKFMAYVYAALIIAEVAVAMVSIVPMSQTLKEYNTLMAEAEEKASADSSDEIEPIITLSTEGQNVIVFMMDRAMSAYVPYLLQEKPELQEAFEGFTYYPNTLAYGGHTNFAAPAIFGGYEYTPTAMNEREDESLEEKHNEALLLMPTLFSEAGYEVTVCDVPYANYSWTTDLSLFDGMENVTAYHTMGQYTEYYEYPYGEEAAKVQTRNFFMYSLMKMLPLYAQNFIYNEGNYLATGKAVSENEAFLDSYSVLEFLPELTEIVDSDEDTMLMMDNDSCHEITLLSTPDYEPGITNAIQNYDENSYVIDGVTMKMDNVRQIKHYHVNMAAFLKMGEWFQYLKDSGVWDNTRIVFVSDHGYALGQFDYMITDWGDVQWYNALLMVKDFGSTGEMVTDDSFMTTADVPTIAMEGLIENPVNPATGVAIDNSKKSEEQLITTSHIYSPLKNNGNVFDTSDGKWLGVHDNIFDEENWRVVEDMATDE